MTEPQETPPQETTPKELTPEELAKVRSLARRLIVPHAILVAAALAAVVGFVLYGMKGGGKEASASGQCEASTRLAAKVAPLARGGFAALGVLTAPKPMPELSFVGPNGPTSLAGFKGKPVLLNAWATWCVPCREEMPALDRLQGSVDDKLTVVAVNVDTAKKERARGFFGEIGVKNLGFYEDADGKSFEALRKAGVLGLPTTFLIGPDGCEIAALAGPAKWDGDQAKALMKALNE